ncbi:MAG: DUF1801 domain-containing protein [Pelobium sp.]
MQIQDLTPDQYVEQLPQERQEPINHLRNVIMQNLPGDFIETISYGMIGYVIPHSIYPGGYHCDPRLPLPFMNIASQKNFIAVYHMGVYADDSLLNWFLEEYPKHTTAKLDMGKSCMRFKKLELIPFDLIGELASKMTAEKWIETYEDKFRSKKQG